VDLIGFVERIYYVFCRRGDVIERLRRSFPDDPALRTLDLGGGDGRVSHALAKTSPGIFVIADIDHDALRAVPREDSLHPVLVPARGRLPFRQGAFDRVLIVDVLHEVSEGREQLLAELARAVRPGGELMVVDFDGRSFLPPVFGWLARRTGRRCRFFQNPEELHSSLERLGLDASAESLDGLRFLVTARAPLSRTTARSSAHLARA
jgi:SAM-dependent methyltransferase